MTVRPRLLIALALLALAACDKKDKKATAGTADPWAAGGTGSSAAPGSGSAPAADDPWALKPRNADAPPPPMASKIGATAGDELAKLDVKPDLPGPGDGKAVTAAAIPKAGIQTRAVRGFAGIQQTGFRVAYAPSRVELHDRFRSVLEENRVFEVVAEELNKTVRLPRTVDIQLTDCGTINAFYDPNGQRIIVCYELLSYFVDIFKPNVTSDEQLGQAVIGATVFGFYHEAGHALIHQLDLPAVGREEDAADQLATLILMAAGDDGVAMALSGAYWFQLQQKAGNETPFWDEHAFDGQRYYNVLCLIYGSDPQKYAGFVSSGNLPAQRAQRCQEEYTKIQASWRKLLEPHLTNDAAQEIEYTPQVPADETTPDPGEAPAAPDEPVAPDEAPAAPAAGDHAITCEQVAEKAVELIGAEAEKQLATLTPEQQQAAIDDIKANLPAFLEQFLAQCAKEDWPDKDRQCVLDASSLDQASKCGIE